MNKNLQKNTYYNEKEKKFILSKNFFQQPYEVNFRSLSVLINLIGKKYYSVRGKKIDNIIDSIEKDSPFKATLGGCIIEKVNQTVIISKEH